MSFMSYFLGRLNFVTSLKPRVSGVLELYDYLVAHLPSNDTWDRAKPNLLHFPKVREAHEHHEDSMRFLFSRCISLFSGSVQGTSYIQEHASAVSDGEIFCYIDTIRQLSDQLETARIVHVGAGPIQVEDTLHFAVYDKDPRADALTPWYETLQVKPTGGSVLEALNQHTTSPDIAVKAMVGDGRQVTFSYIISSLHGAITIPP